jgi:myosin heavy subunit
MNFDEFQRRFSIFLSSEFVSPNQIILKNDDHKQSCINLVRSFDLDSTHYKLGNTQVAEVFILNNYTSNQMFYSFVIFP